MALKKTSSTIIIGAEVTEPAANTFSFARVDLQLNPLDNEVFVVTGINLDPDAPDSLGVTSTTVNASLSVTQRTTVGSIADSNVMATARSQIICNPASASLEGIGFVREDPLVTPTDQDYLGIIATNDFFLNLEGVNNGNPKNLRGRVYGYRAKADSAVYAALVQSELLSA